VGNLAADNSVARSKKMKTVDELAIAIINKVREMCTLSDISNSDIASIAGITMSIMYEEDINNKIAAQESAEAAKLAGVDGELKPTTAQGQEIHRSCLTCGDYKNCIRGCGWSNCNGDLWQKIHEDTNVLSKK
jgi:hypothetical protein